LHHAKMAARQYDIIDVEEWRTEPLSWMAECHAGLHHHDQANAHASAALVLARRHRQPNYEACALMTLGRVAHAKGRFDEAGDQYGRALTACRKSGDVHVEAGIVEKLAEAYLATGEINQAQEAFSRSLALYRTQNRLVDVQRVRRRQGKLSICAQAAPKQTPRRGITAGR
ncbi:MAG TPA: tetratricopeptide repeat protein, partial [Umezawaea sp.]|nr:tetratricopeptide repeat protein [Umezawaea sp.]